MIQRTTKMCIRDSHNKLTGEFELGERTGDNVVGYIAYFKLINGFEKYLYMSKEDAEAHAIKYSQTYKKGFGLWKTDFDAMAIKTVLKRLLSKYGILSVEMQSMANAISVDGAVIRDNNGELCLLYTSPGGYRIYRGCHESIQGYCKSL